MPRGYGKRIQDEFFSQMVPDSLLWTCKWGTQRKDSQRGYKNIIEHVQTKHPEDLNTLLADGQTVSSASETRPTSLFYGKKTIQINGLLHYVIVGLQPFTVVDSPVHVQFSRFDPLCCKTLTKYIDLLTTSVEQKFASMLPTKFALVSDGWTVGDTHYVALFATFTAGKKKGYDKILLAFSPFDVETSQDSDSHLEFITFVLSLFRKSLENVVVFVADNCSNNKPLSSKSGIGFVRCASHRFNLAMKDIIKFNEVVIEKVRSLMKKLSYPIPAANLRDFTHLRAKCSNDTRWSSTAEMLKRCLQLKDFLPKLEMDEIDDLTLATSELRKVEALCIRFENLYSVTKALENENINLAEARAFFDTVIEEYPETVDRLGKAAMIVHQPDFESGIIKVLDGRISGMTHAELAETDCLRMTEIPNEASADPEQLTLTGRALKRRRLSRFSDTKYMDLKFIVPTSNMCERLVSTAGFALTYRRRSIIPASFEKKCFSTRTLSCGELKMLT